MSKMSGEMSREDFERNVDLVATVIGYMMWPQIPNDPEALQKEVKRYLDMLNSDDNKPYLIE